MTITLDAQGYARSIRQVASPNCDDRPGGAIINLVVIHAISLPPGEFTGDGVERLFTNHCDPDAHPVFAELQALRVSAHFFIRRDGEIIQFVSCLQRAWHAGISVWQGRERCNDFSIGIELEGSDYQAFAPAQYTSLIDLLEEIRRRYPIEHIVGHSDIAPGRKTDPGPFFDWRPIRALPPV